MYDIIIIGAGPAGMTAAIYGLRAEKKVLVLEQQVCGGQIVNAQRVENYPGMPGISGLELAKKMCQQVKDLGGEIKYEKAVKITASTKTKNVKTDGGEYRAGAVIIATGAKNRELDVDGQKELVGKGLSYCATCDGNFYNGKVVAVVGGGNTALEDAMYLSGIANKVYLIHRRDNFRAEEKIVRAVKSKDNIELVLNSKVSMLISKKSMLNSEDELAGVEVTKNDLTKKIIEVDGIFVAIGHQPQNQDFADIVELDENGYIKTNDGVHTNVEKIYVAGDARAKDLRQLTTAVSDGSMAATVAIQEID